MSIRVPQSPQIHANAASFAGRLTSWFCRWEGPTWSLLALIYGGFAILTAHYHSLPWWLVAPLGGWIVCWHGQLQHEHLHGHPTRWPLLNGLLVAPSLGLWLPYMRYRAQHMAHHQAVVLTRPGEDNESFYVSDDRWRRMPSLLKALFWANQTLAGRMLLGPVMVVLPWLWSELRALGRGEGAIWLAWLAHAVALAPLLWWLISVCAIPLADYLLLFVWPSLALTLIRSFHEHRTVAPPGRDSVVVERPGPLGWLFLNNNLHALHHEQPALPWYKLPAVFAARRAEFVGSPDDFHFDSYGTWFRRYLFRPKDSPVYRGV